MRSLTRHSDFVVICTTNEMKVAMHHRLYNTLTCLRVNYSLSTSRKALGKCAMETCQIRLQEVCRLQVRTSRVVLTEPISQKQQVWDERNYTPISCETVVHTPAKPIALPTSPIWTAVELYLKLDNRQSPPVECTHLHWGDPS